MFQHTYMVIMPDETGKPVETQRQIVTYQEKHASDILSIWQQQRQDDQVTFRLVQSVPFTGDEKQLSWHQVSRVSALFVAHLH